jgi:hypothetical protein
MLGPPMMDALALASSVTEKLFSMVSKPSRRGFAKGETAVPTGASPAGQASTETSSAFFFLNSSFCKATGTVQSRSRQAE